MRNKWSARGRGLAAEMVCRLEGRVMLSAQVVGEYTFRPALGVKRVGMDVAYEADGKLVSVGWSSPFAGEWDGVVTRVTKGGSLDKNFGGGGFVTWNQSHRDLFYGVAIDQAGRIIAVGETQRQGRPVMLMARFKRDGSTDYSFANFGWLVYSASRKGSIARDVTLSGDQIIVTGTAGNDVVVLRLNGEGRLSKHFGTHGVVVKDLGGEEHANSVAVDGVGRVVVAGTTSRGAGGSDMFVMRLTASGKMDRSFDRDGVSQVGGGGADRGNALALDQQGKIYVGGAMTEKSTSYMALARLSANGALDSSFGEKGWVIDREVTGELFGMAVGAKGSVLAAGEGTLHSQVRGVTWGVSSKGNVTIAASNHGAFQALAAGDGRRVSYAAEKDFVVWGASSSYTLADVGDVDPVQFVQLTPFQELVGVGAKDRQILLKEGTTYRDWEGAFGDGGKMMTELFEEGPNFTQIPYVSSVRDQGMVIQPDGKIVVLATWAFPTMADRGFLLARFEWDGRLDETFGEGGVVREELPDDSYGDNLTLQPDGELLVGGSDSNLGGVVYRYNADGTRDASFSTHLDLFSDKVVNGALLSAEVDVAGEVVIRGNDQRNDAPFAVKLRADGSVDSTFGDGGLWIGAVPAGEPVESLGTLEPDGTFLAIDSGSAMIRRGKDGKVDASFGVNGRFTLPLAKADIEQALVAQDVKVVLVGQVFSGGGYVMRLNSDGTIDTSFGEGDGVEIFAMPRGGAPVIEKVTESGGVVSVLAKETGMPNDAPTWARVKVS